MGGGNSAFEEGIYLSEFAKKLTIITRNKVKADEELLTAAKEKNNIEIYENEEIQDLQELEGKYKVTLKENEIIVDGIFSYIGYTPSTEYLSNLGILEEKGYIEVNETETVVPGLYACGDIIKKDVYQIITASSEGAISALKAKKYITNLDK